MLIICFSACQKDVTQPEGNSDFAIYIVENNIYGNNQVGIDTLILSEYPLLSSSDITKYSWSKHQIDYPESVYKRLTEYTDLWRKGFVVVVENERIYWGLFQSYLDSYACQNPVIILFPRNSDMKHILSASIAIHRSYFDGEGLESEPDPRADPRIYKALEKAGILIP